MHFLKILTELNVM